MTRARGDAEEVQRQLAAALGGDGEAAQKIREIAHRLTGTAGSYGFMAVTSAAAATVTAVENGVGEEELAVAVDRLCQEISRMGRTELD